jgi:predicted DCC family thiol-disulfide oxidoreductase YuxK
MVSHETLIVYDGDCILCRNYARLVRLRETVGKVELIDARSSDPRLKAFWRQGYDLDRGMLLVHRGEVFHGSDAVHAIALMSSGSGWFNRLNARMLSNRSVATLTYPLLKLARRISLLVFGKGRLRKPQGLDADDEALHGRRQQAPATRAPADATPHLTTEKGGAA